MGALIRVLVGVPAAFIVVIALFLLMYGLIKVDVIDLGEDKEPVSITIGRQIDDTEVTNQKKFERPQLDQPPPPPPAIQRESFAPTVEGVQAAAPSFDADVEIGTAFNPDRDAQPLVRVDPSGWERCIDRAGTQDSVRIQFDVTPQGQVTNVDVIDSTDSCLNRYAIRAAERWKYQPKIVEGEPQWRRGTQTTFRFSLSE
ncbi:energy transducer TonB [Parvularcula dongshanensis]|uniref:Protein TonB n=1 Tax=Parvularcula dongshanensis TaxID=1173995 RepID=A0A840I4L5_9PROT|nr:energy transducer TonB [Parvularcula dongshanensis]MBB4659221.1 protein TonB [Parvularcula dongshanensis]